MTFILRLHMTGQNKMGTTSFDWKDALADASISGAVAAITCLIATQNLISAIETGLFSFVSFLALKRGIVTSK